MTATFQPSFFSDKEFDPALETKAFALLKMYEPLAIERCEKGYIVGYSGGKDSDCLAELFFRSGVKHHIIHNHTTLDAPETVYYIRRRFKAFEARGVTTETIKPKRSMWQIIVDTGMFPTRTKRFCCSELKEHKKTKYAYAVYSFGVRKAESVNRAKNRDEIETRNVIKKRSQNFMFDNENAALVTTCYRNNYNVINPIAYWREDDVWNYLKLCGLSKENINPLYALGAKRVGCIGCPMTSNSRQDLDRYPKYRENYIKAANRIMNGKPNKAQEYFKDGTDFFNWWISGKSISEYLGVAVDNGNMSMFDEEEDWN
jgi:phosphoadenosine phosphosulfate reductase